LQNRLGSFGLKTPYARCHAYAKRSGLYGRSALPGRVQRYLQRQSSSIFQNSASG
jgi:hypothetical protein